MIKTVINLLATLTLIGDVMLVGFALLFLLNLSSKNKLFTDLRKITTENTYLFTFIVSLIATLGSLFFSEVAKYQPCVLCWYQRILMYPQALLTYLALVRNERVIGPYLLLLNVVGAVIAAYHYLIQRIPSASVLPCSASGPDCTFVPTLYYGYITIPLMALTAFLLNISFLLLSRGKR